MSWLDRLATAEGSINKWRLRAGNRLLVIRELETRIQVLERANAALVVEAQFWEQRCKSVSAEIEAVTKQKMSLCEVIKKTRGFGES